MNKIFIVAKNKVGVLATITELLAEKNINIDEIDVDELQSLKGMEACVISVDKYDLALETLRNATMKEGLFKAVPQENLVLLLTDKPGALAHITKKFKDADINIHGMHILERDGNHSLVGVSVDHILEAKQVIADCLIFPK
ncbi:MAG: ACT domain-containing protein [Candidatus Ancaeobacter aquaticus]|nr:ACT domain-containing protein [Candidatus Ancaeobacter aquaticus]